MATLTVKAIHDSDGRIEYQVIDTTKPSDHPGMGWVWKNSSGWHYSVNAAGFKTRKAAVEALADELEPNVIHTTAKIE
jgi:hypothetical protein